jgi:hypothetical protein
MIFTIFAALVSDSDPPKTVVLRKREHLAAVDEAMPGDDAVAGHEVVGHPEVETAVRDELVEFFERAGIEKEVDAFARRQLAGVVLPPDALLAALCTQAFTACDFSQSFRKFSRPMAVSGWL